MLALKVRTASLYCFQYSMGSHAVQGLQSRVGMISGVGNNDNFGESILDTFDMCYVLLGGSIEN